MLQRLNPFPFWQSITGSLDPDEQPVDTARRELFEETGLRMEGELQDAKRVQKFTIDPRWRNRYAEGVTKNTEHEFRYKLPKVVDINIDKREHDEYRWLPIDDAIDAVWSWTNKDALRQLRAELRESQQSV